MHERIRGILPVLQTPFDESGAPDIDSLKKEIAFCIEVGVHGVVFPVIASEFEYFYDDERHRLVEIVVKEVAGRVPVVVGVAGPSAPAAALHARHAAQAGADAVVAMPPYISRGSRDEIFAYYQAISKAAGRPVFVQHAPSGPGMDMEFIARLLNEVEHICYIKEEMDPSAHNVSALVKTGGEKCHGIFGGALGRWMLSEMERGAMGFLPGSEVVDVHVQIWDAYQAGDKQKAREIFNQLLPLINLTFALGVRVIKWVLVRRGIFKTTYMRMPGALKLDAEDERELGIVLEELRPLFRV